MTDERWPANVRAGERTAAQVRALLAEVVRDPNTLHLELP